jgi:transcription elongation factor Elf1
MTGANKPPMICKECGVTMNYHAEKLVDPTNVEEARRIDPKLGGLIEEMHTCPGCGRVDSRRGE